MKNFLSNLIPWGKIDFKKIIKGGLIAAGSAFLTYLAAQLPSLDLGRYAYILFPVFSFLINAGIKALDGVKE